MNPLIKGFVARRLTSGRVTYGFRYRNRAGQQRWLPLGLHGQVAAEEARDLAKKRAGEVADDRDPMAERITQRAAATNTVDGVLDKFLVRYVRKRPLKSAGEIERAFNVYVRPRLGKRSIYNLGRRDIVEMLDAIEDENGSVMCDRVLAYLRKAFNWQASRDEQFNSPIVRGMQRTKPNERARQRILDDQEIRDLWTALEDLKTDAPAPFPSLVKTLLLTAQRRDEVASMNWLEIEENCWTLPAERSKNGQCSALNGLRAGIAQEAAEKRLCVHYHRRETTLQWILQGESRTGQENGRVAEGTQEKAPGALGTARSKTDRKKLDGAGWGPNGSRGTGSWSHDRRCSRGL